MNIKVIKTPKPEPTLGSLKEDHYYQAQIVNESAKLDVFYVSNQCPGISRTHIIVFTGGTLNKQSYNDDVRVFNLVEVEPIDIVFKEVCHAS